MEDTDKRILTKLVKAEAKKLKKHASKEQLAGLDFKELRPKNALGCIYGQMTGNCFSSEAFELIKKCCGKMFINEGEELKDSKLNGILPTYTDRNREGSYYSPIEVFISFPENRDHNNKLLINFLKGKTETLVFEPF